MKTQYPMIPFPLIVKATDGDTEAINQILHHYRGYITKRSLRLMNGEPLLANALVAFSIFSGWQCTYSSIFALLSAEQL